jgi:hypothetical protein
VATLAFVGSQPVTNFRAGAAAVTDVVTAGTAVGAPATRGPELLTAPWTSWTLGGTGVTADGAGLHFVNTASALAHLDGLLTEDNAQYELIYTIANYSAGNVVPRVYGQTAVHTGVGATRSANGTYSEIVTCNGAGSPIAQVRFTPNNAATFDITAASCKKVLP